jgi:hypothetical protein
MARTGGLKFTVTMNSFTTLLCTAASSIWSIKGLYSAPRPALEGLPVGMCGGKDGSNTRVSQCASTYGRHWQHHKCLTLISRCRGFGGLEVACWPLVPKFAGSHPAEAVGFLGGKTPQHAFLRREIKLSVPCRSFTACKRSLNVTWNSAFR